MSDRYNYDKKGFNPSGHIDVPPGKGAIVDRRDGVGYVYTQKIVLAVNLALATGRPLLVSGPSGSGKSSLAASVANIKKWSYYEQVISSRTQARDLLWHFDNLRRLRDIELRRGGAAGSGSISPGKPVDSDLRRKIDLARYIEPGVLWWAFNPESAARRGISAIDQNGSPIALPFPEARPQGLIRSEKRAVVLLDEIDKADPDVPNDLLVAIGSLEFNVEEISTTVKILNRSEPPLVIITTNGERALPIPFLRRCLTLELNRPLKPRLLAIAQSHFGSDPKSLPLYDKMADILLAGPPDGTELDPRDEPSTAEYIDALNACESLKVFPDPEDLTWKRIEKATLWKHRVKDGSREERGPEEEEEEPV